MPSSNDKSSTAVKAKEPAKKQVTIRKTSANLLADKGKKTNRRTLPTNAHIEDWLNNKLRTFDIRPMAAKSVEKPKPPSLDTLSSQSSDYLLALSMKSSNGNKSPDRFTSDPSLIVNQLAMIQQGLSLNQDADPDVILVESQLREASQNALNKVEWQHPNVPFLNKSVKYLAAGSKITYDGCDGIVKHLGKHPDPARDDVWLGIELEEPFGTSDGVVFGKCLFETKPGFGVFTRAMKVHYRGVNGVWLLPENLQNITTLIPHDDYNLEILQRLLLGEKLPSRKNWTKMIPTLKERKLVAKRSRKMFGLTDKETLRSLTLKYTMAKPLLSTSFNVNRFSVNDLLSAHNSAFPLKEINDVLKASKFNSWIFNERKKSRSDSATSKGHKTPSKTSKTAGTSTPKPRPQTHNQNGLARKSKSIPKIELPTRHCSTLEPSVDASGNVLKSYAQPNKSSLLKAQVGPIRKANEEVPASAAGSSSRTTQGIVADRLIAQLTGMNKKKGKADPDVLKLKRELRVKLLSNLKQFREALIEEKKKMLAWISIKAGAERQRGMETTRLMHIEELKLNTKETRARRQQRRLNSEQLQ